MAIPRYSREAQSESLSLFSIERPFSNFNFIEDNFPGLMPLSRILSQVRAHDGKTMGRELLSSQCAEDIIEENEDLETLFQSTLSCQLIRLSFFSVQFSEQDLENIPDSEYLGYAIIKTDSIAGKTESRVFESVIRPSRHRNNFIRGAGEWPTQVAGRQFTSVGYLYAQQNGDTNVCAHVAARTVAARFHPSHDMTYREMNRLPSIAIDHSTKKITTGLSTQNIRAILEAAGARCIFADYTSHKPGFDPPPYQKLVYGSMESGYPAILIFSTSQLKHAIPIFGHTLNQDTWAPNAEAYFRVGQSTQYIPSDAWMSTFIGHDDNFGSNFCISKNFLHTVPTCAHLLLSPDMCEMHSRAVTGVIATVPQDIKVNPLDAEVMGADYLFAILQELPEQTTRWRDRLNLYAHNNQLVLRTILITGQDYINHLSGMKDWEGNTLSEQFLEAFRESSALGPDIKLWMVELSMPELFSSNMRKVGEILLFAQQEAEYDRNFSSILIARIPGYFVAYKGQNSATFSWVESGIGSHVPLYSDLIQH